MATKQSSQSASGLAYRDRVYYALRRELTDGVYPVGARLPPVRALADRFHTSAFPVHEAIMRLNQEGYVVSRRGSGTYVRDRPRPFQLTDSAMLLTSVATHLYGDLTHCLLNRLQEIGMFAAVLDTGPVGHAELVRRAQYSDARFLILHAGAYFHFEAIDPLRFDVQTVIAVLAWESELYLDRIHRVLVDHAAGSRLLVEHLWAAGHRHLLLAGNRAMIDRAARWDGEGTCPHPLNVQGTGFQAAWRRRGGHFTELEVAHENPALTETVDRELATRLAVADPPTAVVGLRDVDAWEAREATRRVRPDLLSRLYVIGDGDTPWSRLSHPTFATMNWNLDQIADCACGIIRDVEAGKTFAEPVVRLVPPRLVVR